MTASLKRQCLYLVTEDRHRAASDAYTWLKTYCRHWATVGQDQQTLPEKSSPVRELAEQHLQTLRDAGLIEHERGFRGNFVKKPL